MSISLIFTAYALAQLLILAALLGMRLRGPAPGWAVLALVAAGLAYDNGVIAAGATLGDGELLRALSWPRFALHAAGTPLIMLAAWQIARAAQLDWTRRRRNFYLLVTLMLAMSAWGVGTDLVGLQWQLACHGDTLRYSTSAPPSQACYPQQQPLPPHGPPLPSIVTVLACLGAGWSLWRQRRWPWLLLAALAMLIAAALPQARFGLLPGNGGEVLLLAALAGAGRRFSAAG